MSSSTAPGRRARAVTITWGAVILVLAGLLLVSQFVTLALDPMMVALGLLVGVGVALVTGGLLSLRNRGDDQGDHTTSLGAGSSDDFGGFGGFGGEDHRDARSDSSGRYSSAYGSDNGDEHGRPPGGIDTGTGPTRY